MSRLKVVHEIPAHDKSVVSTNVQRLPDGSIQLSILESQLQADVPMDQMIARLTPTDAYYLMQNLLNIFLRPPQD